MEKNNTVNWIIKYSTPNKLVIEPKGSVIQKIIDTTEDEVKYELYIQVADDNNEPEWITIGDFLAKALKNKLHSSQYLDELLKLFYENK